MIYAYLTRPVILCNISYSVYGQQRMKVMSNRTRKKLSRNEDGVTAIEFALITPVFLLMIMGIIEFSMIMFTSAVMEGATNNSARLGKTGYIAPGSSRQQQILANVGAKTAGLLDPTKITLTSEVYTDFDDIGKPEPCISPPTAPCPGAAGVNFIDINGNGTWDSDMGQAGLGNPGDVVVYTVSYPWPIVTPIINTIIGSTFTITARTVVRNEPYGTFTPR
jgi:Flp pilus assembly pilin Flp